MRLSCNLLLLIILCLPTFVFAISRDIGFKPDETKFFSADYIEYNNEEDFIYAKGNIKIIKGKYTLSAESVLYDIKNDLLWAEGNIKIRDNKNSLVVGETAFFKDKLKAGIISDFILKFNDNTILASRLAKRLNENNTILYNSVFTPCIITCNKDPFWQISAKKAHINLENHTITYRNIFFEVYGVPIFYTPYFSHPTPSAPAKSGILVPKIRNSSLTVPVYIRAKKNLDITLTPRIAKGYNIFEGQLRHKLLNGAYTIEGGYGKIPYSIQDPNNRAVKKSGNRFYIFTKGDFSKDKYNYGFNLKTVSDKAFLKNYYYIYDNYLNSKLYVNRIKETDYFLVEGLHFKGLREQDTKQTDPFVLPRIRSKNIINLNDDETTYLTIENNISSYVESASNRINRTSIGVTLSHNILTNNGHLINISTNTSNDIYNTPRLLTRSIPELELSWRYPLARHMDNSVAIIEPIVSSAIGPDYNYDSNKKFELTDDKILDTSECNIFLPNRFSDTDYHEFGKRISYGINTAIVKNSNTLSVFLGGASNRNNIPINAINNRIGKIQFSIANTADFFYRFKVSKHLKPIKQEFGGIFHTKNLQFKTTYIKLDYSIDLPNKHIDKIEQLSNEVSYNITHNWIIGNTLQLDLANKKRPDILLHGITLTYLNDCFSITAELHNDYTSNSRLGIKKNKGIPSFAIGLKGINM